MIRFRSTVAYRLPKEKGAGYRIRVTYRVAHPSSGRLTKRFPVAGGMQGGRI